MRILLVDDEAAVLQAHMAILKTMPGHDVRVAANAAKAIEHAAALGGIELLITDVVMDPTDGFTLREELQALYPEMRTIFVSGYDLSDYAERIAGSPVLSKPVEAEALRAAIADVAPTHSEAVETPAQERAPEPVPAAVVPIAVPEAAIETPVVPAVPPAAQVGPAQIVEAASSVVPAVQSIEVPATTPVAIPGPAREMVRPAGAKQAATPAATVRAVAQASAVPVAVPSPAKPEADPQPTAKAAKAPPKARAVSVPAPTAPAAKVPVAVPQSGVRAAAPASSAPTAVPSARPPQPAVPVSGPTDPLIGVQLGDYRVQQLIGHGAWGKVYAATQVSVNRRVGLNVLDPARAQEEQNRAQFLADARAKAAVQHPLITSVFEADERNGLVFYTHESLDGVSMQERIDRGLFLDEKTGLLVVKAAGEALQYLWSQNIAHGPISASAIRVGEDQIARLENIATAEPDPNVTVEGEINTVGNIIRQLVPEKSLSGGFRALLGRMTGGMPAVASWPLALQAVKALEPKVIPVEAAKIKAADDAAMRAVEAARKARKRTLYASIVSLVLLVSGLAFVVWYFLISGARRLDEQVEIPAGSYIVGSPDQGGKPALGAYEIDKYEVTINDYAKFVAWCEKNPDKEHEFDHPRGDRIASHVNDEVKILIKNAFVRGSRVFKQEANAALKIPADPGVEVDLNSPMVAVTFWDAYAYAHWRGKILEKGAVRDLPTEEEWEVAARGPRGYKYPWGDELKPKNFNSNQGYKPLAPGGNKTDDGYNYWAPVDAFTSDESDFKVRGMAGNVCEWVYRKEGSREIPLLKGGSFASDPIPMWGRVLKIPAEDALFVYPAARKPKTPGGPPGGPVRYYVGDDLTASFRSLYVGFRTVKRK